MPRSRAALAALCLLAPGLALAQPATPPAAGGPPPGRGAEIGPAAGPATQPPRTDDPQAVNRGTDGAVAGLEAPGATGTTPQGFLGSSTAGERRPEAPVGGAPPQSPPPR